VNNLFQSCNPFAVYLRHADFAKVYCNWFRDCGGVVDSTGAGERGAIHLDWTSNVEISRNHIETSWYALALGSGVNPSCNIHHNFFTRCYRVMNVGVTEEERRWSQPLFNNNCFVTIQTWNVLMQACNHNTRSIDATNNFWNTTSPTVIRNSKISDCVQDVNCPCVEFEPILTSCTPGIGLCTN
jgi:hypothetical protein